MNNLKFLKLYLFRLINRYINKLFPLQKNSDKIISPLNQVSLKRSFIPTSDLFKKIAYFFVVIIIVFLVFQIWKSNKVSIVCPVISEGVVGVYNRTNLPPVVTSLLSEPLITLDKSGKPIEKLVESVKALDDNSRYILSLRKDLYWNDGIKVKSSDIQINLPDTEVSYPDDLTINFKLADTFTPFLTLLTQPVLKPGSLVGLGKYKVNYQDTNRNLISKLVLQPIEPNKCLDNPYINIRFYPDEQTAKTAFELGEIDVILIIQDTGNLAQQPNVIIKKIQNYSKLAAIFYNTKDTVLDKNFRKALSFSTNLTPNEDIAKTSIPPVSWAFNNDLKVIRGDAESAKTALAKVAKFKENQIILTTTPFFNQLAEKIVADWKNVGINAVVRVESGVPQNFQALLTSVTIPHDPDQYALWHSTQNNTNLSKYSSPRVDKDLEDGRKTDNIEKRKEEYWDFQKVLQDDVPATFLYFPKINVVYRKKIEESLNKIISLQLPGS